MSASGATGCVSAMICANSTLANCATSVCRVPTWRSNATSRSGAADGYNQARPAAERSVQPSEEREMRIPLYQVDAFADRPFTGNPAAVCPLEAWLPDEVMQAIAAENNLSETAFFVAEGTGYQLRWFTPVAEVDLCGHATLASAHVIFRFLRPELREIAFETQQAGTLTVTRDGDLLALVFPSRPPSPCAAPAGLTAALGGAPAAVLAPPHYPPLSEPPDALS